MAETNIYQERHKELNDLLADAIRSLVVTSKGQFAQLIGVTSSTLSAALNGNEKYLSGKMITNARKAVADAKEKKNRTDTPKEETAEDGDLVLLMKELVECFNKERESHEKIVMAMLEALKK